MQEKTATQALPGQYDEVFLYVPSANKIIRIEEGTGDNLLKEDLDGGYVDYICYEQYLLESGIEESDGGMVMLTSLFRDRYRCTGECIPDVLDVAYGRRDIPFILLKKEEEKL